MEGDGVMNWFAFDKIGQCFPLGKCGDFSIAMDIAEDKLGECCAFIMTAEHIKDLATKVREME